ncbi:FAD:protein FMN transferase [Terrimonas alba]|uniref:FAD:protein FMN transferase n=1 Tax=Terrimonas alba TaxID=3349636 RepID=UPI0035F28D0A
MKSLCLIVLCFFNLSFAGYPEIKKIQINGAAQGTTYHITYYAQDSLIIKRQIDSVLNKIDSSLSLYKPYSLVNQFNQSTSGITADQHLMRVVTKALAVFRKTKGLFDITVFPLTDAWGFGPERKNSLPDSAAIKEIMPCINSRLVYTKRNKIAKRKPCVQLDPNGIAQGYSVDVLADFFDELGVRNYIIELGGEIRVSGRKPGNEKMSIGIEAPGEDANFSMIERVVYPDQGAITTSGNYRRYHESNGRKITHLLNPKTGYTLQNELISVTVFAKDAMTADAYDNALMVMGLEKALAFVDKKKDLAAHFIYRTKDGKVADTMSKRFRRLLTP